MISFYSFSQSPTNDTGLVNHLAKDSVYKTILEQNKLIGDFKEIKEDILAEKVFEKSKSKFINWITFGGIFLLLLAIVGYFKAISIIKGQVTDKLQKVSQDQILEEIKSQSAVHVENLITVKKKELDISTIAKSIQEEGNTTMHQLLAENKGQFDSFVIAKKEEIELLVKQLKESADAFNNPIGSKHGEKISLLKKEIKEPVTTIDYTADMPAIKDVGDEGSVVGFVLSDCMEYHFFKQYHKKITFSPRQIYYYARVESGFDLKGDNGAYIKSAIKAVKERGTVEEKEWPYVAGEFNRKPPAHESKAVHYRVKNAIPVKNINDIKSALVNYGPVAIAITMYESFDGKKKNPKGIISMPKRNDNVTGGTGICLVGYNDEKELFKFKNSWGISWGEKGYGYVSYEYMSKFSDDGWVIDGIEIVNSI